VKRIPKQFRLGAHDITVKTVTAAEMAQVDPSEPLGLWVAQELTIYVQKPNKHLRKEVQMHTFWHEYYHALFYLLGRERLSADETLVDQCGLLQMQAMNTAQF
jgi:hypothetical protein